MFQLNAYAKELTAEEIRRMADDGMCSLKEDENEDVRVLKWEDMLKKSRTGTVTDIYLSHECVKTLIIRLTLTERKVNEAEGQLLATQQTLEETQQILQETQQSLEQTLEENEEIEQTLNQTQTKLNTTELEIQDISSNLTRTSDKLQTALKQLEQCNQTNEKWDWDLFFQESYVNTTISSEVAEQLRSSWDDIAERMIGFKVTEQFISFWQHIDQCTDQRPWSMLLTDRYLNKVFTRETANELTTMWDGISDRLIGVTMTKETIELLKYIEKIYLNIFLYADVEARFRHLIVLI
ncbi:uncharacterized protein LOC134821908 [Bolinopsis microptera]|uniref:uncharacterized protein LOC134821908 n=1 Tax=Bolinopsis microptera TaxID=2820187 RepID=UPI00307A3AF6